MRGIVILWFATKTINLLPERWRPVFRWTYFVNGFAFIGSIATVLALYTILPRYTRFVFRIEWLGIWSFSAFWALKTWEYWITDFEKKVATGRVKYHRKQGFVNADGR